ncbi:MAG: hypothetical protein JXB23_00505 [Candidatus Aminicenantes bacterium]|nr:hypothetical protein [Candidatus Aminicenantes bacterium]
MKTFSFSGLLAKKKITIIFLLAIILPSLFIAYLSLKTFAQRRETLQQLLDSNLWISGNAALKSFENALWKLEKELLAREHFENLSTGGGPSAQGKYFLLDGDHHIIYPERVKDRKLDFAEKKNSRQQSLDLTFRKAENLEFAEKDHLRAAELYQKYFRQASSKRHKVHALEALGRCHLILKNYERASEFYVQLLNEYSHLKNKAGHPYGIIASLQLYEISKHLSTNTKSVESLILLYEKIKEGEWLIDIAAYDFFIKEIESSVGEELRKLDLPESHKFFQSLKQKNSAFLEDLLFADFLNSEIIPRLKERINHAAGKEGDQTDRFFVQYKGHPYIISYQLLPRLEPGICGGFCWDLVSWKKTIIPQILNSIEKESNLEARIIDGEENVLDKDAAIKSSPFLTLPYRQFPLPWKFVVSQPGLGDLHQAAKREVIVYGVLLSVIVTLMVLGALLIARDIIREREATRQKTDFVHNVSHELKTPLTLIRLYGETLQRKTDLSSVQKEECYEIITKESERLSHLINNVLDFSRIDMGRKEFDFQKGNLAEVVRDALESYRYHLEKKGFSIQENIDSRIPQIRFDREAISSVVINLLSNAVKYSYDRKEVEVKLFQINKSIILQVTDKGIGIAPKEIKKIFKRFYRLKNKALSDAKGSGLGLTLVKHITEAHGGRIEVESEPGKGSTFSLILPIDRIKG